MVKREPVNAVNFSIHIAKSTIEGKGAFALQTILAKRKIGNLAGEIIPLKEARKRVAATRRVAMVEFGNGGLKMAA